MSENNFYSSLSAQEIENTLVGAVVFNSNQSLTTSQKEQARQNIGAGASDTKIIIEGFYDTLADLQAQIPVGTAGDVYAVGTTSPYNLYIWDAISNTWKNNGTITLSDAVIDDEDIALDTTWSSQKINADFLKNADFLNRVYPVGSIYMSVSSTSPATLFGGTWEQIKDAFLLSAGDTYTAGNTGGSATHTHTTGDHVLTTDEIPSHSHSLPAQIINYKNGGTVHVTNNGSQYYTWANWGAETGYKGGGLAHNHGDTGSSSSMPPYLVVYVWKRTA